MSAFTSTDSKVELPYSMQTNHLNWLCSHWQGKKLAIKLLYKVIA